MQQVNSPSQQPVFHFDHTPPNKNNQSRSPRAHMGEIDLLYQKVALLQNENKLLKVQLEQANGTIKQMKQPSQSLFKTTTFELVVLQKAVEQLEQLKQALLRRRNNPQYEGTLQTEETIDMVSELRSRLLETQQKQEVSDVQVREGRRQQLSDIQIKSPMRQVRQKGSPSNPYRSKHDSTIE